MISQHAVEWLGYPVKLYPKKGTVSDYRNTIYRLAVEYDGEETPTELFARFLAAPQSKEAPAIIFGLFSEDGGDDSSPIIEALVAVRDQLPNLKGIFLGDIISEENEISWIQQRDVSPLFEAYPALEHFRVRGGAGLTLGKIEHARLKSLVIESGGLDADLVRDLCCARLPQLEHLEIWLGSDNYGWNGAVEDLEPLFSGKLFPKLKRLGLRDSEIQDEIAIALARAPITAKLETLDLSLGTLSDKGAAALLNSDAVFGLKKLDLHHHFLTDKMMARLKATGLNVDLADPQTPDDYDGEEHRYVAVSE
jgi:hypothetical protein